MKAKKSNSLEGNNEKIIRAIIFAILSAVWMIVIFLFSAEDGEASSLSSDSIYYLLLRWMPYSHDIIRLIRKTAHLISYAVLGFLYANLVDALVGDYRKTFFISLAFGVCYAASDEYHQSLIPGRSPKLTDILIDACDLAIGIALAWAVKQIIHLVFRKNRVES